ncbi:MAG: aromatic-ring-hydroxylating dioxygenase subunit beta [Acidimicrobiales bacterium]
MTGPTTPPATVPAERIVELTQVLHREAELLDDGRYEDWLALLDPDIVYTAPIPADQLGGRPPGEKPAGAPTLRYFHDDLNLLRIRVAKIRTGLAQTENPPSRTVRLIGTVTVDPEPTPGRVPVRSAFILYRHRRQRQVEILAGHRHDRWHAAPDGWRLGRREVRFAANVLPTKSLSLLY